MSNRENEIIELLRRDAVTPDEVAEKLGISWATANGHLLKLVGEGKAVLVRKCRVNVYQTKGPATQIFHVPNWVKPRSLEQFSNELAKYFPKNVTAAEMIEKEHRKA